MKVHFAGNGVQVNALLAAGVQYNLMSFYDIQVRNKKSDGDIHTWNKFKHLIIDSGLFTFMFGSEAKKDLTMEFCEDWLNKYINFVNRTDFRNASFVEMDVQKCLGVEEAWELRKRMKAEINKGVVINVYHLEDEDPTDLIDYCDYIAISLPELRLNVSQKERKQIVAYITKKAQLKGKKVHILGCTEKKYMEMFSMCESCDSTSWTSALRWGRITSSHGTYATKLLDAQKKAMRGFTKQNKNTFWSALFSLQLYNSTAGDQS